VLRQLQFYGKAEVKDFPQHRARHFLFEYQQKECGDLRLKYLMWRLPVLIFGDDSPDKKNSCFQRKNRPHLLLFPRHCLPE